MKRRSLWAVVALALLVAVTFPPVAARADVSIALPLQGHYRPGKYMPARVTASSDPSTDRLTLWAAGALTTEIALVDGKFDGVVPWLSIRHVSGPRWEMGGKTQALDLALVPLEEEERLIGYAGADPDALAPTFPAQTLVRVGLDVTDPLPGAPAAWEALDGVVLDAAAANRLSEARVRELLASGMAIAIRAAHKPGGGWPWVRQGNYWVVHLPIEGPSNAFLPAQAYTPTRAWVRGWPIAFRRKMLGVAVIYAILVTGLSLLSWRWRAPSVAALTLAVTAALLGWRAKSSAAIEAGGDVVVLMNDATQRDRWTYHGVLRESDQTIAWTPITHPVFDYRTQADELSARLACSAAGPQSLSVHLKPNQSLAIQTRIVSPLHQPAPSPESPITSPMRLMANDLYAGPADQLLGQIEESESRWATVVIEQPSTTP